MLKHEPFNKCRISIATLAFTMASVFWVFVSEAASAQSRADLATINRYLASGTDSFPNGDFEEAVRQWNQAADLCRVSGMASGESEALGRRAEAVQKLGFHGRAIEDLTRALSLAEASGNRSQTILVGAALGNAYFVAGDPDRAVGILESSVEEASRSDLQHVAAASHNNLGNALVAVGENERALDSYKKSQILAREINDIALAVTSATNAARVNVEIGELQAALANLADAEMDLLVLSSSHHKALGLIKLGRLFTEIYTASGTDDSEILLKAFQSFELAANAANQINDRRSLMYAMGYMAGLYELQGRIDEALDLTRRAVFLAQDSNTPEALYLWQWQTGRLLDSSGDFDTVIEAYRLATYTLQSIRQDLTMAQHGRQISFRQAASPLFLAFTDLLLRRARQRDESQSTANDLIEARDTVELLKAAELQDYFEDECVSQLQAKQTTIDDIEERTVVLYPIFLPDRMELLISSSVGLQQVTVERTDDELTQEIRDFRIALETRNSNRYRRHARILYDRIIRPLETILENQQTETLVVIPEDALRGRRPPETAPLGVD